MYVQKMAFLVTSIVWVDPSIHFQLMQVSREMCESSMSILNAMMVTYDEMTNTKYRNICIILMTTQNLIILLILIL